MYLLKRLEVISLINLIKNELYKIFHKKGIYVVLIITALYTLLTNFIYNSDFIENANLEDSLEIEIQFATTLEEENETDSEEYLNSKIYIATYKYAKSFGEDSWQSYILIENEDYYSRVYDIISRITKYELNQTNNIDDYNSYESAKKEKEALTQELKNIDWKEFLNKELIEANQNLVNAKSENEKYLYQARIDTLNLRLKYDIKYGYDEFNEYLMTYQRNHSTELSYQNVDEKTLKQDQINNKKEAIKESELAKYKIENHIEQIPYGSNHYIFTDFYTEYFIMILILIVLISGSIVSDEFSKGTIKLLLVKPYSRIKILMSKYITVLLMVLFSIVVTFLLQMIIGGLFFGYDSLSIPYIVYNLSTNSIEAVPVLKYFLLLTISILPQLILLATLGFTLSTIFTSTSIANTLTIVGAFGSDIINALAQSFEIEPLKFFVTLNWDWSVYLFGGISPYKGVTFPFSVIICLIYLIIMLVVTTIVFKKKNIKNV